MTESPWNTVLPEPGDFDRDLLTIDPRFVELHEGSPTAGLRIMVSVEGDDAKRLERLAGASGRKPGEVVADLLRNADRSAA
ncbi:MAG: hypothetical protein ABSG64_13400 [Solirubrobacteraceae bacterium]|jgi:hypothetical protein